MCNYTRMLEQFPLSAKKSSIKTRYVSSGEISALAVLICAKVLLTGDNNLEVYFGDEISYLETNVEDKNLELEFTRKKSFFTKSIDIILPRYENRHIEKARKKAMKILFGIIKDQNLANGAGVNLSLLAAVLLYTYFVEGDGRRADDSNYYVFKQPSLYDTFFSIYEMTDELDFLTDHKIALNGICEL